MYKIRHGLSLDPVYETDSMMDALLWLYKRNSGDREDCGIYYGDYFLIWAGMIDFTPDGIGYIKALNIMQKHLNIIQGALK